MTFGVQLATLLLLAAAGAHAQATNGGAVEAVRICVPVATTNRTLLAACAAAVGLANSTAQRVGFVCVGGGENCTEAVVSGDADLVQLGGTSQYDSYISDRIVPLVAEEYADGIGSSYYSVAAVNAELCTPGVTLEALRGLRSCHTGYRRTAGWQIPVGALVEAGVMPVAAGSATLPTDAASITALFNQTCAPQGLDPGEETIPELCTGCGEATCDDESIYWDYPGALRCLMEDAGDVAFFKHTVIPEYARGGSLAEAWATKPASAFRLLCPAGGCAQPDAFESCTFGRTPSRVLSGTEALKASALGRRIQAALVAAAESGPFLNASTEIGGEDFIFGPDISGLRAVNENFTAFFGADLFAAFGGLATLEAETVRWCTSDANETATCEMAVDRMNALDTGFQFSCVEIGEDDECAAAIANGTADIKRFGAGSAYTAYTEHELRAIASENLGPDKDAQYYAVALVKAEVCAAKDDFGLADLRNLSSCHTGYRRTAGWNMPIGNLINSGIMPLIDEDADVANDAESAAAFFAGSCAVGTRMGDGPNTGAPVATADGNGTRYDPLCAACDDPEACVQEDIFYDYAGVVRGVMEDGCQVGFTKQDTMLEVVADGTAPEPWSTVPKADLRLVCATGCAPVDSWATCNMARVPTAAIMTRANFTGIAALQRALTAAADDTQIKAMLLNEEANPGGHVLGSSAVGLDAVTGDTATYLDTSATGYEGLEAAETFSGPGSPASGGSGNMPEAAAPESSPTTQETPDAASTTPESSLTPAPAGQGALVTAHMPLAVLAAAAAAAAAVLA